MDDFAFHKELVREELVKVANSYLSPYAHTVYWGEGNPIVIYKRSMSYYVSTFVSNGFALTGMEELPKIYKDGSGEPQVTTLPGFITYRFTKI
jgi:hypothetical protein